MEDSKLTGTVNWTHRPAQDLPCAILFALTFLANLVCGILLLASKNVSIPEVASNGNETTVDVEMSDSLLKDYEACVAAHPRRMLEEYTKQKSEIWSIFSTYPQIPIVIILFIVALGVSWLVILNFCAKPVVWATAFIKVAAIALIGVWMLKIGSTTTGVLCFIGAGVFLVITILVRKKINRAAEHLELAIKSLRASPSVFVASGLLKTAYVIYLCFYCATVIAAFLYWEVNWDKNGHCYPTLVPWTHSMITFLTICMVWVTYWVSAAKTHVTAISTACWYFDLKEGQDGRPKYPAIAALQHVFTTSAGTLAFGSIICTIVERILNAGRSRLWWTSPLGCFLRLIFCIFQTLIQTLTKFTIIVHALNGRSFFGSAKTCFGILKRHFVGATVTDQVGTSVLRLGAYSFSLAVGFAAWAWTDNVKGWDTLSAAGWGNLGFEFLFYIFLVLYVYLTMYPLPTIFLIAIFSQYLTGEYSAPMVGLFCAAVANILLTYIADVVLNAMDTIFLCYAIGKDNNLVVDGHTHVEMYKLLGELPEVQVAQPYVGGQPTQYTTDMATPVAEAIPVDSPDYKV